MRLCIFDGLDLASSCIRESFNAQDLSPHKQTRVLVYKKRSVDLGLGYNLNFCSFLNCQIKFVELKILEEGKVSDSVSAFVFCLSSK
jgi:hypothetical protein